MSNGLRKTMEQAEEIADKARNSLSNYCMKECKSYCCRKGYLILTPTEVKLVCREQEEELKQKEILLEMDDGNYSLQLGNGGCPSLIDDKCLIHKNPNRPDTCRTFPLFIEGNKIRLSKRCPAIRANKLYPHIRELTTKGYKVDE